MLQNQAGVVFMRQIRGKSHHRTARLMQAGCTQNGPRGKVAETSLNHLRTDNQHRNLGGTQNSLGH